MRVNSQVVAAHFVSDMPLAGDFFSVYELDNKIVVTRGYLYKKGDGPFMWQRRFFELRPASGGSPAELCYKETEEVYQPA